MEDKSKLWLAEKEHCNLKRVCKPSQRPVKRSGEHSVRFHSAVTGGTKGGMAWLMSEGMLTNVRLCRLCIKEMNLVRCTERSDK